MQVTQAADHLLQIQPEFKADLVSGVEKFIVDSRTFVVDYTEKYVLWGWPKLVFVFD